MYLKSKNKLNFDNALNLTYPIYLKYNFDVWSIKIAMWHFTSFVYTTYTKSSVYFTLTAHLNLDYTHDSSAYCNGQCRSK